MNFLSDAYVQALGWTLIHSVWQGGVVAIVCAAGLRAIPRTAANARYVFSCAMLGAMVLAAMVTFAVVRDVPSVVSAGNLQSAIAPEVFDGIAKPQATAEAAPRIEQSGRADLIQWVVLMWILGVGALSVWHVVGWIWLQRLRAIGADVERWEPIISRLRERLKISRAVRLIECARVDVPAVVGALRPVILVPIGLLSEMSSSQVEAILIHELAHIRRHDYLVNLLQTAVETLLFYHPATWWISSQIRQERENCCDDIAVKFSGDAVGYAEALAALERARVIPARLSLAANDGRLIDRIRRLLRLPPTRKMHVRSLAAAILALACGCAPLMMSKSKPADATAAPVTTSSPAPADEFARAVPPGPEDLIASKEDFAIGAGDLVTITITGLTAPGKQTLKSARVSDRGTTALPKVDGPFKIAGLSETQAEEAIAQKYRESNPDSKTSVNVDVAESRSRGFAVLGAAKRPGQYQVRSKDFRLIDAAATAEIDPLAVEGIYVIRKEAGESRIIKVPADRFAAGDQNVNVVIRPGDMVICPPRKSERSGDKETLNTSIPGPTTAPNEFASANGITIGNGVIVLKSPNGPTTSPSGIITGTGRITITGGKLLVIDGSTTAPSEFGFQLNAPHVVMRQPTTQGVIQGRELQFETMDGKLVVHPKYEFIRVVVGKDDVQLNGKHTDAVALRKILGEIPAEKRAKTVLEVAAMSDATFGKYEEVFGEMSALVRELKLAYVSNVGIERKSSATTKPGAPAAGSGADAKFPSLQQREKELEVQLETWKAQGIGEKNVRYQSKSAELKAVREAIERSKAEAKVSAATANVQSNLERLQLELRRIELDDDLAKYGENHPRVQAQRERVKKLKAMIDQLSPTTESPPATTKSS